MKIGTHRTSKLQAVRTHRVLAKFATPSFFEAVFSYFGQLGGSWMGALLCSKAGGAVGGQLGPYGFLECFFEREGTGHLHLPTDLRKPGSA